MQNKTIDASDLSAAKRPVFSMTCICPEMQVVKHDLDKQGPGAGSAQSMGGETSPDWDYRTPDRTAGKDAPIGGCLCQVSLKLDDGSSIPFDWLFLESLQMTPSS